VSQSESDRAYYLKNKARLNAQSAARNKRLREADPEKHRRQQREYTMRRRRRKLEAYSAPEPPANCEACGVLFIMKSTGAHLDHNHETGEFRGWLCSNCNTALGLVGDNADGARRLLEYIESRQ
jgi:hypothetical protein